MLRLIRAPLVFALLLAVALAAMLYGTGGQPSVAAPSAAAPAIEVGIAPTGRNSMEFVGIVDQDGLNFSYYGYVTHLYGITNTLLFANPLQQDETTARFTFHGAANMTGRSIISNVFNLNAAGTITFYFDPLPGADFDDPSSFIRGTAVATATTRFHNVLTVIAPDTGLASGVAELEQIATQPVELLGQSVQLGRNTLQQRFTYTGFGVRLEPATPRAVIIIAADGQVTGASTFLPQVLDGPASR
ncbi:MAG: hypothetical protein KJZ93_08830 [Caldilineaceae bacterium]|nr:hypothetical protein [Caldilineaceae bacterium]